MQKTLIVYRPTATEALTHLDKFNNKMVQFVEEHPNYTFESSLKKTEKDWEITVTINDNEK